MPDRRLLAGKQGMTRLRPRCGDLNRGRICDLPAGHSGDHSQYHAVYGGAGEPYHDTWPDYGRAYGERVTQDRELTEEDQKLIKTLLGRDLDSGVGG